MMPMYQDELAEAFADTMPSITGPKSTIQLEGWQAIHTV